MVRAVAGEGKATPSLDFVAEAVTWLDCGGDVRVQKSRRRQVVTLAHGPLESREIRKQCRSGHGPPLRSAALARLVKPGHKYGYDLVVQVGLARYLAGLQRAEIQRMLRDDHGIELCAGSVTALCDRFLSYLEALHVARAPALREVLGDCYPMHLDATCERGKGGLFVKDLQRDFIRQGRPVLLFGRPGTGKSHMSIGYGHLAVLAGYTVRFFDAARLLEELYGSLADDSTDRLVARLARQDLLIIDDVRDVPPKAEYASLMYDLINARYGKKATIVSSNITVERWGKALGNPTLTGSLIDRLMDRTHVINIKRGKSYRSHGPEAPPEHEHPRGLTPEGASDE